ncbi:dihydroxyacetone kinase subunit L [Actinopolyspora erythraea]|uniref:Dihydroxyacetone kinase n=1 Tax=Actinopolyspora erythraea TaxID=414996 RepID=A0A099D208_9ACTN|nr:dihydroxyacetone kinase subunit DhaL [Actinopolyspora erythraea]ASU77821.1 dihydroxyacetone kinase subunit L [Actinopolyspora erythraea]KGI80039.1 dihydroxyacetone kinase [Actinopolyspora erythraea]
MPCTARDVTAAVRRGADAMAEHRDELVELDRAIGDGDHGENMDRGFRAVLAQLDLADPPTPGAVLKLVATSLISSVGGASGPLFGTAFLRAASGAGEAEELDGATLAASLRAAVDGVAARGKAEPEDKTMIDALLPAVRAAEERAASGADPAEVLAAAAEAATTGARSTVPLIARKGRASYLGDRSAGHLDPGARSAALLLAAFADVTGVE